MNKSNILTSNIIDKYNQLNEELKKLQKQLKDDDMRFVMDERICILESRSRFRMWSEDE